MPKIPQSAQKILDKLRLDNVNLQQRNADLVEDALKFERQKEYAERQLNGLHRDFVMLWNDERLIRMRHGWLEEAASDVVRSCPEHLPGLIVKLADEIGMDIEPEKT